MEKFKAVEKEMKTKAFSKEGLSAAAKLDPKEKEKLEACQFLSNMVEELERQVETLEAEEETLQATVKKGKKDTGKSDRLSEIGRITERHKWHQSKLELLLRSLENGNVLTEQVQGLQDSIKYYVEENQSVEFMEDDEIYDDLNLEEDEGAFGMNNENDRVSSQDAQSIQDDVPETADGRGPGVSSGKPKSSSVSEPQGAAARRPSNQLKSPLPALATLHTTLPNNSNIIANNAMKPAPIPTRAPGETLKYASAAAAAAANDKIAVGIAPLPPPQNPAPAPPPALGGPPLSNPSSILSNVQPSQGSRSSATTSPSALPSLPASVGHTPAIKAAIPVTLGVESSLAGQAQKGSPATSYSAPAAISNKSVTVTPGAASEVVETPIISKSKVDWPGQPPSNDISKLEPESPLAISALETLPSIHTNGESQKEPEDDESIYHLPPSLQDLVQSFEVTKSKTPGTPSPAVQRLLNASYATCPELLDAEKPRHYRPQTKYLTPRFYPQEPSIAIDDPSLYSKIDTDTLFYIFYYRQNTYQQYLAAKSLKSQSWRFHKQYQTWFQRHEEPKTITDEYEQGTYRFFDYESTWYVAMTCETSTRREGTRLTLVPCLG